MLSLLALFAVAQTSSPPDLPPLHGGPAPITCPVGGETFKAWRPNMYSTYGERPDGRPYSYLPFPFPLPECPTNRLVIFAEFTPAEVDRLSSLIASPEYRRLVATETPYYRANWLSARMGRPIADTLDLLLQATWEVTPGSLGPADTPANRAKAARYQRAFVDAVRQGRAALPPDMRTPFETRAANALRQLGNFGGAEEMRRAALADLTPVSRGKGWPDLLDRLAATIMRRDPRVEPLDLIPRTEAQRRCDAGGNGREALDPADRIFCAHLAPTPAPAG